MEKSAFSFKHITTHPAIVEPNILRVIKHGEEENFETHYIHVNDFNRLNSDQPELGADFKKWLDQKPGGHPVLIIDGQRAKELRVSQNSFKAIIKTKHGGFSEIDLQDCQTIEVTTALGLKNDLKEVVLRNFELELENKVNQLITDL